MLLLGRLRLIVCGRLSIQTSKTLPASEYEYIYFNVIFSDIQANSYPSWFLFLKDYQSYVHNFSPRVYLKIIPYSFLSQGRSCISQGIATGFHIMLSKLKLKNHLSS